jgi:hypothetical protein
MQASVGRFERVKGGNLDSRNQLRQGFVGQEKAQKAQKRGKQRMDTNKREDGKLEPTAAHSFV